MLKKITFLFISFCLVVAMGGCGSKMNANEYSDKLYHAIVNQDEAEFERLLAEGGDLNQPRSPVNFTDYQNVYPLEIACEKSVKMAYRLWEAGADPLIVDDYLKSTPLIFCMAGEDPLRYKLAMDLLLAGADPSLIDKNGRNVFKEVGFIGKNDNEETMTQSLEFLDYTFEHYDVKNIMDEAGDTVLNSAVKYGNTKMVSYILDKNYVDINCKGQGGRTPLMDALRKGDVEMTKLLLSYGASKEGTSNKGKTCSDFARESENQELMELIGVE